RRSHESPVMDMLYKEYFETPGSEKSHHLLHTSYVERQKY
ncbi:MAG: iron hydrogenase small subunit, partial [Oscillospiraceae bacterium]|nr:iron hydrogenase small subunit [Oscillospiraceae bacterium]